MLFRSAETVYPYAERRVRLVAWSVSGEVDGLALRSHDAVGWFGAEDLKGLAWAPADVPLLDAVRCHLAS